MRRIEHGTGGTVTMGVVHAGHRMMLEVVVLPALLRAMPWYRGGIGVTALVLPYDGGELEIRRAGLEAPLRLLARMNNRLDKLPAVQLRAPLLPGMAAEEHAPQAVAFDVRGPTLALVLTLPPWARRTPPVRVLELMGERP